MKMQTRKILNLPRVLFTSLMICFISMNLVSPIKVHAAVDYNVTIDSAITNGTVVADKTTANEDEIVTLTVTPEAGYVLDTLTVTKAGGGTVSVSGTNTFEMPEDDVTVTATFVAINYNVTIDSAITNGTVVADKTSANKDETVTLTVTPEAGYVVDSITVTKAGGGTVSVSGTSTFEMPEDDVTVVVMFRKLPTTPKTGVGESVLPWIGLMVAATGTTTILQKKKKEEVE